MTYERPGAQRGDPFGVGVEADHAEPDLAGRIATGSPT